LRIAHFVLFTTIIFVTTTAHGTSIKQRSYVYRYDCAKGLQDESYLICGNCDDDRPTQAVALSFRMSQPQQVVPETQPPSKSVVSYLDTIHFNFGSASLLPNAEARLDTVDASGGVRLAGYTCTVGSAEYNEKLSQRRADAVARYLSRRGISILYATGYGESTKFPGHAKNRRVEIYVEGKETTL
jgi:OOP family OmpA-OmpF porin